MKIVKNCLIFTTSLNQSYVISKSSRKFHNYAPKPQNLLHVEKNCKLIFLEHVHLKIFRDHRLSEVGKMLLGYPRFANSSRRVSQLLVDMLRTQKYRGVRVILAPMFCILQALGLGVFSIKSLQKSSLLSYYWVCLFAYYMSQFFVNMYDMIFLRAMDKVEFLSMLGVWAYFIAEMVSVVLTLFMSYFRYDRKIDTLIQLFSLECEFLKLNIKVKYSRMRWFSRVFFYFLMIAGLFVLDLIIFLVYEPQKTRMVLMMAYSARLILWTDICYFIFVLKVITAKFKLLNEDIAMTTKLLRHNLVEEDNYFRVQTISRIHYSLRELCKIQNFLYGLQLATLTVFMTSVTTCYAYMLLAYSILHFVYANAKYPISASYGYLSFYIVVYYSLCCVVLNAISDVELEGNSTIELIQKLQLEVDQQYLNQFLKIFSRQIYDDKIEFSACGFFPLDFTLIHQVISSSSMYLIILLQFHFSKLHVKIINNLSS